MIDKYDVSKTLKDIISLIKEDDTFYLVDTYDEEDADVFGNYIWIGTKNGIGILDCHYEIIFHIEQELYEDFPSVEVHFEGSHFQKFKSIVLPAGLSYASWNENAEARRFTKNRRIVFSFEKIQTAQEALENLRDLHNKIGNQLETLIQSIYNEEKEECKQLFSEYGKNIFGSKLVDFRNLKERYFPAKTIEIEHSKIQKKLIEKLHNKFNMNGTLEIPSIFVEAVLQDSKRADLLLESKNGIDLFEIKTYSDPIRCIREALGQLYEYKWRLEQMDNRIQINKLIIVGPNKCSASSNSFINNLNENFISEGNRIKIEYFGISEIS